MKKQVAVCAFVNQKGGVGKTTSSVTVAHLWAMEGRRVLIIDLDAQGNVADCLGLEKTGDLNRLLIGEVGRVAIRESGRDGLSVVLGDKTTARTRQILSGDPFGVYKLREVLEGLAGGFDAVVLDVAPGADILQLAALVACTSFVIPVSLEHLALVGVREALESVASLKRVDAFRGGFAGVLPTMLDRRIKGNLERLRMLAETFGRQVAPPIPTDATVGKAQASGKTLVEFDARCPALVGVELNGNGKRTGGYEVAARWLAGEVGL
ncbi:MAG: ParA family protein [Anaerolineae bacterium]|jgi:chromosome partitioning protein|nr:ParA family protein [Anaerolineae bacterium]